MIATRAYGETAKDARRKAILDAAGQLFEAARSLPTAALIAKQAGLAKGTVYLYFESLEELFGALVLDGWDAALGELEASMASASEKGSLNNAFPVSFAAMVETRPVLMLLDGVLPELKTRMSDPVRQAFNERLTRRLMQTGERVEAALQLPTGRGVQLLVRCHAMARGLWQSFEAIDPSCAIASSVLPSFSSELREALGEYWRGANADVSPSHG